jgi:hypothetical protein
MPTTSSTPIALVRAAFRVASFFPEKEFTLEQIASAAYVEAIRAFHRTGTREDRDQVFEARRRMLRAEGY